MKYPSPKECYKILKEYGTPEHVIDHCQAVSCTAVIIAEALNKQGYNFDTELIRAGGLLHDVARVHDKHHIVGADFIESIGYKEVADIVREHMTHPTPLRAKEVTNLDLLCLGDRLCKFGEYVGLEDRMQYIIEKTGNNPVIADRIHSSMTLTRKLLDDIGEEIGESVDKLVKEKIEAEKEKSQRERV